MKIVCDLPWLALFAAISRAFKYIMNPALKKWLKNRPQVIKDLADKWPPATRIVLQGITHYVTSYVEYGTLGVSEIDPRTDYDEAIEASRVLRKDILERLVPIGLS